MSQSTIADNAVNATSTAAIKATSAGTYGGSAVSFLGGYTANDIAAYGGLCFAALAFLANMAITIYFKRQHLALARDAIKSGNANIVMDGDK